MSRLPEIANPQRKPYASDLSDAQWEVLKLLVPAPKGFGHPVEVDFCEIVNAIFSVQRISSLSRRCQLILRYSMTLSQPWR